MRSSDFLRKSWLIAKVRRRISGFSEPRGQLRQARDAVGDVGVLPAAVEQQRLQPRTPRALEVVAQRVPDVECFGAGRADARARPAEDLRSRFPGLLDRGNGHRPEVLG